MINFIFELSMTLATGTAFMFWRTTGAANNFMRFLFMCLTLWGVFETAKAAGYIVGGI